MNELEAIAAVARSVRIGVLGAEPLVEAVRGGRAGVRKPLPPREGLGWAGTTHRTKKKVEA